jgi:hypothetical protein
MNNFVQSRAKVVPAVSTHYYLLPAMLTLNTVALLALDRLGGVPDWIKTAAALFLAF